MADYNTQERGQGPERNLRYAELCKHLKQGISEGSYKPGDRLPTERDLCAQFGVSRATVRRALEQLRYEKLVISRQGSGVFVSPEIMQQSLQYFYSFSGEMQKQGKIPSDKLLSFQTVAGSLQVCQPMGLESGTKLYRIVRLRLADNKPYFYETTFIPKECMPNFTKQEFAGHKLYDVMSDSYQIVLHSAKESFRPVMPSALVRSYLGLSENDPCMYLLRITRDIAGNVVEYSESIGRGDCFLFEVELKI